MNGVFLKSAVCSFLLRRGAVIATDNGLQSVLYELVDLWKLL